VKGLLVYGSALLGLGSDPVATFHGSRSLPNHAASGSAPSRDPKWDDDVFGSYHAWPPSLAILKNHYYLPIGSHCRTPHPALSLSMIPRFRGSGTQGHGSYYGGAAGR